MSDLFSFINTMFSNQNEFKKIKIHERGKHFFMCNRFMSIKYPIQASYFNHIKINPGQAVSSWQEMLGKIYNRTPPWMYIKTKKIKEEKKKSQTVSNETIRKYCEIHKLSQRQIEDAFLLLGKDFEKELILFEKMIS